MLESAFCLVMRGCKKEVVVAQDDGEGASFSSGSKSNKATEDEL